jgi:acetoin utilization protein AcuB
MTRNPITVRPDLSVNDARAIMDRHRIDRLPVLNKNDRLVGIVSRKEMLKASPSAATSLDMYEISYLLSKLKIEAIMEKNVITVEEDEVVEEAARIMVDENIGCLPVLRGNLLVGIITDRDLFRVFINVFGARHPAIRITISLFEKPGQLARLVSAIAEQGGNIVSLVSADEDEDASHRRITCRIAGLSRAEVEVIAHSLPDATLEDLRDFLT